MKGEQMMNILQTGKYRVTIEFTLENEIPEQVLDEIFENAIYMGAADISDSDIGIYNKIEE